MSAPLRRPPESGPPASFAFPEFATHRLDNGLMLYLAPYPRGPLIHQLLVLPGGAQLDRPEQAGLAALAAALVDEGTDRADALEIAFEVETLGGYLTSNADWDSMNASLGLLARHSSRGLRLLADIATRARFPDRELERLRSQHLAELQRRRAQPSTLASDALARLLYPGTIYSSPVLGTPTTLPTLDRADILAAAGRDLKPDGAALILVGDLEPDDCLHQVEDAFARWSGPRRELGPPLRPPRHESFDTLIVDRPHAPQTELWLGSRGVPRAHPDRPGLVILNSILGGKFTSRLNLNLRERLGITYGISSSFAQRRGYGPFVVAASVDTEATGTAAREILNELRRLQDDLVTVEELADSQSYLRGIFPYTLQRIEGLADRLADLAVYDLPIDYFATYLDRLAEVTREDLRRLAREHLRPDSMCLVAVGPRTALESQLDAFGSLSVVPSDEPLAES